MRELSTRSIEWVGVAIALALALAGYVIFYRPRQLRWGATNEEVARPMPGDDIVAQPVFNATRAVTVDARPDEIWPWLVQIGFGRAGWYSYDILDNLGRHSSEEILAEYQQLEPGDLIPLGPGEASGLYVKEIRPNESMVWWERKRQATSWVWGLYPIDGEQTRLVTRVRNDYQKGLSNFIFGLLLIEPADFPMMRKCMLGIKRRAEAIAISARAG
ncbi:MAG TPA: hypothetical protein VF115_12905 [Acidimicrobiia bacterium]